MEQWLNSLLQSSNFSILTAFILGLLTAISPCPLATNITAIAFIGKDIENKRRAFVNGIYYTLGRAFTYTAIGVLLFFTANSFEIRSFLQKTGEKWIGPLMIIIGLFMLNIVKINFSTSNKFADKYSQSEKKFTGWSSFIMGVLFALAFCPFSGVIYFGMLIPMTIASASGLYLPIIFAIGTGLPVIIFAYLLAFTIANVGKLFVKMKDTEKWVRYFVGSVFIIAGAYYSYVIYIK